MVRRDATDVLSPPGEGVSGARCASPTGASPVPVGVGAPGSRPQVREGDLRARAGRQEPARRRRPRSGEQAHRPQHQVKPAASTELQFGGRAAHVTAKATSEARVPKLAADSGGVRGAACVQGEAWNTRGPSAQPLSRQRQRYKAKPKTEPVQRDSRLLEEPAGNHPLSGASLLGGRVMLSVDRPLVSRVRESRMHGLKGGPALSPVTNTRCKDRIYQCLIRPKRQH